MSCLLVLVAVLLTRSGAHPAAALRSLSAPSTDPAAPVVALSALLAWLCVTWLAVVCLLAALATAPGVVGRAAALLVRACAPWAVRRLLAGTLGVSTLLVAPTAALADTTPVPTRPATATTATVGDLGVDWPGVDWPGVDWPGPATPGSATTPPTGRTATSPHAAAPRAAHPRAAHPQTGPEQTGPAQAGPEQPGPGQPVGGDTTTVVVRPGDSLWTVAARALGASATPKAVAAAWPAWWAANRETLGADPGLIHPGDRLVVPAQDGTGGDSTAR